MPCTVPGHVHASGARAPAGTMRGRRGRAVQQPKANLCTAQPTQNCQLLSATPAFKEKGKADYRADSTSAPGERGGREGNTKLGEELKTHPSEQESILS